MSDLQTYQASYLTGIDFYNSGANISSNPFAPNTYEHELFNTGYMDVKNKIWQNKSMEN